LAVNKYQRSDSLPRKPHNINLFGGWVGPTIAVKGEMCGPHHSSYRGGWVGPTIAVKGEMCGPHHSSYRGGWVGPTIAVGWVCPTIAAKQKAGRAPH